MPSHAVALSQVRAGSSPPLAAFRLRGLLFGDFVGPKPQHGIWLDALDNPFGH
jgi:hypothetical protein